MTDAPVDALVQAGRWAAQYTKPTLAHVKTQEIVNSLADTPAKVVTKTLKKTQLEVKTKTLINVLAYTLGEGQARH